MSNTLIVKLWYLQQCHFKSICLDTVHDKDKLISIDKLISDMKEAGGWDSKKQ